MLKYDVRNPAEAVNFLRGIGEVNWRVIGDLILHHCKDQIPNLPAQVEYRNSTGLAAWLDELADDETATLPERMANQDASLSVEEGFRAAHRIVLLRALGRAVKSLHGRLGGASVPLEV